MKDGMHPNIPDAQYHSDTITLSSTGARLLLPPSCPAKFKQWRDNPPTPKPAFDIGHVVHRLVLGKGADIVEVDAVDWRSKDAKEQRDLAHAEGKTPVLTAEFAECRAMADAVLTHPIAGPIFLHPKGDAEISFYAQDPITGVKLRARVDWIHYGYNRDRSGRLTLLDLKTSITADPDEFTRRAAKYRYHFQEAFYRHVIDTLKLAVEPRFLFVVVEKHPPYLVSVVEFDHEAIAQGTRLVRQAIDIYRQCSLTDTWPGYPEHIHPISLPLWAFDDDEMVIA